tara:strand:- start:214 stop:1011 length:798 start_codon:yes stop_codon:yes gene_type:complete
MFSIIKTGLNATTHDMSVISNNLANASTNGFKRSEAQFEDMYFSQHNNSTTIARGMGVKNIKPRQSFTQGSMQQTNGSLDLAIMGEGFFVLGDPIGTELNENQRFKYTRDGSFQLDRLGNIVNTDGLPVLGVGNVPINIPVELQNELGDTLVISEISVKDDGKIEVTYGLDRTQEVGQLILADFVNEHGLKNIGNARFEETPESGLPTFEIAKSGSFGKILPGALEKSNTDVTEELVTMLRTQHAFNGCSKILQTDVDTIKRLLR